MTSYQHIPRRSCLYVPGSNRRALEKAKTCDADVLIFDLEDAVAPDGKEEARANIVEALKSKPYGARELVVRVNGLNTAWGAADIAEVAAIKPDGILAPKIDAAEDVLTIQQAISNEGANQEIALWAMVETPAAILNIKEIAEASKASSLTAFVMGTNDLAKELKAPLRPGRAAFQTALSLSVIAARANDLTVIDGVFNDIKDEKGFAEECDQGQALGFDGKTLIHPAQIAYCNQRFSPTESEIERARAIIAAFEDPANDGKGVILVDGQMTELLHLEQARSLVAIVDAISEKQQG